MTRATPIQRARHLLAWFDAEGRETACVPVLEVRLRGGAGDARNADRRDEILYQGPLVERVEHPPLHGRELEGRLGVRRQRSLLDVGHADTVVKASPRRHIRRPQTLS